MEDIIKFLLIVIFLRKGEKKMKIRFKKVCKVVHLEKYSSRWFGWSIDLNFKGEIVYDSFVRKAISLLKKLEGLNKILSYYGIEINFTDKYGHYTHIGQIIREVK